MGDINQAYKTNTADITVANISGSPSQFFYSIGWKDGETNCVQYLKAPIVFNGNKATGVAEQDCGGVKTNVNI